MKKIQWKSADLGANLGTFSVAAAAFKHRFKEEYSSDNLKAYFRFMNWKKNSNGQF